MTQGISDADFVSVGAQILRSPVAFTERFLQAEMWSKQKEILESVEQHPLTAVRACHAPGKTWVAARAVLWWLARHQNGIALTTAPTWPQVEKLLWGEIHSAVGNSLWPYPPPSKTELKIGPRNYALGLSTDESDRFQGFHGDILIVVDEAPGVRPAIFLAIQGIRAGGRVHVLMLGNPTVASGYFYDAFGSPSWNKFHIDGFDTPNLTGVTEADLAALPPSWNQLSDEEQAWLSDNKYPHLITKSWIWERYNDWGPESGAYQSRVRGEFPLESDDTLYSMAYLEQARLRESTDAGPVVGGIDVAGPGKNETVLALRRGMKLEKLRAWRIADPKGALLDALRREKDLEYVNVDAVGIGYHVWRFLKDNGIRAYPVVGSSSARDSKRFANRKVEMYWEFRDLLHEGLVANLSDPEAIAQLLSIKYEHNGKGQVIVEGKHKQARRGIKSPDRAEAIIMAYTSLNPPPLRCI